ncbi:MAG: rhomboid family intramembrane serine protease [Nannocystaceae bacterium]|nr:rhomboid family intramembrane serine protease [bacterium]
MFDEFLLLSTAMVGLTLLRSSRGAQTRPRGYTWVLAAILALTVLAVAEGSRFIGVVAMALAVLIVAVPAALEWAARVFFGRGMLRWAVWAAGLRSMLMLGAGLGRQQQILSGLAVLEREGVDAAIVYFRGLANDTDDGGELALINEQIVSMLLYGQRWDEGIRHYESRFHPGYAALRPALVLGLMRAYGEVGSLEQAAALLQALEDGPVGNDPRALGLVSQARLTFLVYAGADGTVNDALAQRGRRQLGLSEASGALFRGLAARQAGDASRARTELERVEALAGRRDDRVVDSARQAIGALGAPPAVLEPVQVAEELAPYVEAVAARLRAFIKMAPAVKRAGLLVATPAILVAMGLGYVAMRWLGEGGVSLLRLGAAFPEALRSGSLWPLLTGWWVHGDPLGLLLDLYTVWLAAPLVERMAGAGRTVVIVVLGSVVGVLLSALWGPQFGMVLGGGGPASCALLGAAVALLFKPGDGGVRLSARRRLLVPLVLVGVAQLASSIPGFLATEATWFALLAAFGLGAGLGWLPTEPRSDAAVALLLVALSAFALVRSTLEDPLETLQTSPWTVHEVGPVAFVTPHTFEPVLTRQDIPGLPLPMHVGVTDGLALRAAAQVEFAAVVPEHGADLETPGLLLLDPSLDAELTLVPADLPEAFVRSGLADVAQAHTVRRNGAQLGWTITRRLGAEPEDPRIVMFAAEGALERQASVYARVLAESGLLP